MSKLVDLSYEELHSKLNKAKKTNNHHKMLNYSVALISKFCYHIDLDREWMLTHKRIEIDEIIASIDEKNIKDKDILISKLNEVKSIIERLDRAAPLCDRTSQVNLSLWVHRLSVC